MALQEFQFQWYNRGGLHDNIECEGVGNKGNLFFDGKTRFAKEQWHVSYDFVDKKDGKIWFILFYINSIILDLYYLLYLVFSNNKFNYLLN